MKIITPKHGQNASIEATSTADLLQQGRLAVGATVRSVGFWSAILLPLVYLPLLSGGFGPQTGYIVIGLLALNLIALFVGHNHTHH